MRLALALALAVLVAGCVNAPIDTAAVADAPAPLADANVVAYRAGVPVPLDEVGATIESALYELGVSAFEPTLGVDADGTIFYAGVGGGGPAIGALPLVMRSDDQGATWTDVSPRVAGLDMPPETNDPYLHVDVETGRVFQFAMAPLLVCAVLSYSDDKGESWTTNPRGCGNTPPWDHQSMVSAHPRLATTPAYPNVLHQCVNNMAASTCSRSLDGGLTWSPGTPVFVDPQCGGLHGHPVAHPDGTVFLPKMSCGVPELAYTEDDGLTWTAVQVADSGHPWPDPAMAVDAEGNVYYTWTSEKGEMLLAVSTDVGRTWSEPIVASPPGLTAHLPAIAAGDAGKIVLAYPATPDLGEEGYDADEEKQDAARWHGYFTIVTDALSATPTFVTVRINPLDDPLVVGPCGPARCPGMTDFIDVVVGPDGRPYASFVDACSAECAASDEGENDRSDALLATIDGVTLRTS